MAQAADCPYCRRTHSKASGFKRCQRRFEVYVWDKTTGKRKVKGK